jgi:hypothetical protein
MICSCDDKEDMDAKDNRLLLSAESDMPSPLPSNSLVGSPSSPAGVGGNGVFVGGGAIGGPIRAADACRMSTRGGRLLLADGGVGAREDAAEGYPLVDVRPHVPCPLLLPSSAVDVCLDNTGREGLWVRIGVALSVGEGSFDVVRDMTGDEMDPSVKPLLRPTIVG